MQRCLPFVPISAVCSMQVVAAFWCRLGPSSLIGDMDGDHYSIKLIGHTAHVSQTGVYSIDNDSMYW